MRFRDLVRDRPYQVRAINSFYGAVRRGASRLVVCAPTGSGKTVVAGALVEHVVEKGRSVNFILDRDILVKQTSREFLSAGIRHGIQSGEQTFGQQYPCQIVSVQSAIARNLPLHLAKLNVVDECHIGWKYIFDEMQRGSVWLGLSASPFREGLGLHYDGGVINVAPTFGLVEEGWLAPLKIFCGVPIEVTKRASTGEYDLEAAATATLAIIGNILDEWEARASEHFGGPAKTIAFANTIADAEAMAEEFRGRGHDFEAYHYQLGTDVKDRLIKRLRHGDIMGLVSVEALQRGFDVPDIKIGIGAHPWRTVSPVVQETGRPMRIAPGKKFAIWNDHAQNVLRHRAALMDFWAHGMDELDDRDNRPTGEDAPEREGAVCPQCDALLFGPKCRECGWTKPAATFNPAGESTTEHVDGELVEIDTGAPKSHVAKVGRKTYEIPPITVGSLQLCALAQEAGKDGVKGQRWMQAQCKKLYGDFAKRRFDPEKPYPAPDDTLRAAVEHSNQLFVDGRKRESRKRKATRAA